jgi:PAS domain S-box-containing protein
MPRKTILSQLIALILLIAIPLIALIGYNISRDFAQAKERARAELHVMRLVGEKQLTNYVGNLRLWLERLSRSDQLKQGVSGQQTDAYFREIIRLMPDYTNLAVLNADGKIVAAGRRFTQDPDFSMATIFPFGEALAARKFYISPPYQQALTGVWSVVVTQPLTGEDGKFRGILAVPLNLVELSRKLFLVQGTEDAQLTVLTRDGVVVLRTLEPEKGIGLTYRDPDLIRRMHQAGQMSGEALGVDGRMRFYDSSSTAPDVPWVISASLPSAAIFRDAWFSLWTSVVEVAALLGLVLLLAVRFSRMVVQPVVELAGVARQASAGNMNVRARPAGPAEIAETAQALNELIEARTKAEAGLRLSEERLSLAIEGSELGLWDWHIPSGKISINARWAMMLDYGIEEVPMNFGRWETMVHPEDRARVKAALQEHLDGLTPFYETEYRMLAKSGRWVWILDRGRVVEHDAARRPVRAAGTHLDINARIAAGHALKESEERFRSVANAAPVLIWMAGADQQANFFNESWLEFTGRTLAEELGTGWLQSIHPDDAPRCRETFGQAFAAREHFTLEYRMRRHDGTYRMVLDTGKPLFDRAGVFTGYIGSCLDITDMRQAVEERRALEHKLQDAQKLESLGVLAGGIAHDFNNLLTGVLGNASLAKLDLPPGLPALQNIEQIELTARRAAELCKQMLAYAGKGRFVVLNIDLNHLIEDTTHLLQISISKHSILRFNLAPGLPAIRADATQLRQIIMNLVINASEAIGERSGVIAVCTGIARVDRNYLKTLRFNPTMTEGDYVFIEISDNGAGMDERTLAQIFDPFFTTKFTGRGLGLAAVLGIVHGHKGGLKVYSEPGRGSTFKVLFPCVEGPAQNPTERAARATDWRGAGTILVMDDEETVRAVAARMLENLGFKVVLAVDGRDGLEQFRAEPDRFAAVLLDLTMPHMDGVEAFRQLRSLQPTVKVLLMSGFNQQDAVERFTGKGLAGFVQKPFEMETLTRELRRVIEGK